MKWNIKTNLTEYCLLSNQILPCMFYKFCNLTELQTNIHLSLLLLQSFHMSTNSITLEKINFKIQTSFKYTYKSAEMHIKFLWLNLEQNGIYYCGGHIYGTYTYTFYRSS